MTLATAWVRRGIAAEFPQKYEVDEAELGRIEKLAKLQLRDAQDDLSAAQADEHDDNEEDSDDDEDIEDAGAAISVQKGTANTTSNGHATNNSPPADDDDLKEYNLSDYDDDEAEPGATNGQTTSEKFSMFGNVRSLAYHNAGEEDPYLVLPPGEDDSNDEREELQILPTDNLILAAKVEDEVPHLEVLVYEDDEDNIYVHHDIMLPAIPLCLEWLDNPVGQDPASNKKTGNYVAVGMMAPEIEIWDLDIVDGMYPSAILGATPDEPQPQEADEPTTNGTSSKSKKQDRDKKKKKKKKPQKPQANDTHHVDAVLTLALNPHHRNLLASGSADKTLKLWDLNSTDHTRCAKSYTIHNGKVTSLSWHPLPDKSTILLSGSADDHTVAISDLRSSSGPVARWTVEADVERVRWDPHNPDYFYVTTEAGTVHYFNNSSSSNSNPPKPLWTLQAHDTAISAFDINPTIPGFLATGSDDKKVKLWSITDNKPALIVSRNLDVGRVFSALFAPDEIVAFRLCVAGSRGQVQVWDTSTNAAVRGVFAGRARKAVMREGEERIVRSSGATGSDDEDESEEEGEEEEGKNGGGWESMDED